MTYELLNTIDAPAELRRLDRRQLGTLADELRAFVLESVAQTGGHLSSNLGTVELTIALHYVFNTPDDRIVWDVGHQSYPHKILTGRREQMATLRQLDGISGFPRRSESPYDTFGTAHSSTSISAALGMALGAKTQGENRVAIAVIGDGAMSAGMAFEAMNNAGVYRNLPLVVVLNDNDMSISPPVGALNRYLARLMSGQFYAATKKGVEKLLSVAPPVLEFAKRFEEHAKGMLVPATMFEEFGFNYIGPIDGHDLESLVPTLQNIRQRALEGGRPQFLHVVTKKGQGYKLAEADPILYHGPGKFNPQEGIKPAARPAKVSYTQVFGQWLCDMAVADKRLVGITPAMREGSGMVEFEQRFPDRYYDVGIAEQHAVTFAGGLACEGLKPVVAIYSTFLQRGYDQLIHDVALQNLPVVFALDRAGLVGADGATHAGAYDMAYLRCIPNMMVMAPADENECRQLLSTAFAQDCPTAVRYPRGAGTGVVVQPTLEPLPVGKAEVRRASTAPAGQRVVILAFGSMVAPAAAAAERLDATVVNMRFVKPLDAACVLEMARTHDYVVTVEEGCVMGGAGSACLEALAAAGVATPVLQLGLPDRFVDHGDHAALLALCGLDANGILASIRERFAVQPRAVQPRVA
ncbi:1-deoxy-D-xylulose-5-phosphate synthase [Ralstonia pseudosolanacearum]|uniref:1-deoxy-D-xylulose-5-phosphate synthase n=1 Tax=Ralstonia solanacearum TaxID=305 RepID=A0A0S4WE76_RALSL|nr:1-deoxy-D-xylulose-5-phosphate synthase [Ralstonia pseudosolanacearum]CUV44622.1 1-deoxyxylulose-5-phosphate synthase, thiamine-requiring, FAD-requiring [Ralstonia solanacearum]MDO3506319.1 1-deoxy-D-xylulose-5-phosphate synthase [Ralstonia pseudosolanacearum]MDO3514355.1 1-deoxy-D-xylulose-5-phosphate synthase [Ralstonia pseudosolanacearum]MDO3520592.1 1-deoxy-D-xylulose-5-phosphate synthase [Ralstonia pseudosolanacearum]MDO3545369.1 1-deoxy-D-xylulose-5-phosphate synthase [Ralstonia pseud